MDRPGTGQVVAPVVVPVAPPGDVVAVWPVIGEPPLLPDEPDDPPSRPASTAQHPGSLRLRWFEDARHGGLLGDSMTWPPTNPEVTLPRQPARDSIETDQRRPSRRILPRSSLSR